MTIRYTQELKDVKRIVLHCSATPPDMDIGAGEIDRWHRKKGWWGIGYHFVIRRDGAVEKGRPCSRFGAHAQGYNQDSIGVCLVGGVRRVKEGNDGDGPRWDMVPEDNFTPEQWTSLMFLVDALVMRCHPTVEVLGHRDLPRVRKACPSFDAKAWWAEYKHVAYDGEPMQFDFK